MLMHFFINFIKVSLIINNCFCKITLSDPTTAADAYEKMMWNHKKYRESHIIKVLLGLVKESWEAWSVWGLGVVRDGALNMLGMNAHKLSSFH